MLNASGNAKIKRGTRNQLTITYHEDDRPAAIAAMKQAAPKGARLIFKRTSNYHADLFALQPDSRLDYVSKIAASILGQPVHEGTTHDGFQYYPGADAVTRDLGRAVHDDPSAYTYQEI